jgi:hypothetical protein
MSLFSQGLTPRLKPLSSRKSATLSVLDIGTSKVVCLIAELLTGCAGAPIWPASSASVTSVRWG